MCNIRCVILGRFVMCSRLGVLDATREQKIYGL